MTLNLKNKAYNLLNNLLSAPASYAQAISSQILKPRKYNERSLEYGKALYHIALSRSRNILDVGTGLSPFPLLVNYCGLRCTSVDNMRDYWTDYEVNHYSKVKNLDITKINDSMKSNYDFITCISVLEHVHDWKSAAANLKQYLKSGGILFFSFPYNSQATIEDLYSVTDAECGTIPTRSFSDEDIRLLSNEMDIIEQSYYKCWTGSLWSDGIFEGPSISSHHDADLLILVLKRP